MLYSSPTAQATTLADTYAKPVEQIDTTPKVPTVDLDATEVALDTAKNVPFISTATKKKIVDQLESLHAGYVYLQDEVADVKEKNVKLTAKSETIDELLNTLLSEIRVSGQRTAELESIKLTIETWRRNV